MRKWFMLLLMAAIVASAGLVAGEASAQMAVPAAEMAAEAPLPPSRSNTPDESPVYALALTEALEYGGASGLAAFDALAEMGAKSVPTDAGEYLYPHIGTVVDLGDEVATVTAYGLAFCVDGVEAERCTGGEFMTDYWLGADSEMGAEYLVSI